MGLNPVPIMLILFAGLAFQALLLGTGEVAVSVPSLDWSGGFIDSLLSTLQFIPQIGLFLFQFLTFQLFGFPWFIAGAVAIVLYGSLAWAYAEYARGV